MVNSIDEARAMAHAAKYPPLGCRSLGGDAAWHYGDDYFETANAKTRLIVQVEHIDAVNCVEEMMAIEGVERRIHRADRFGDFDGPAAQRL